MQFMLFGLAVCTVLVLTCVRSSQQLTTPTYLSCRVIKGNKCWKSERRALTFGRSSGWNRRQDILHHTVLYSTSTYRGSLLYLYLTGSPSTCTELYFTGTFSRQRRQRSRLLLLSNPSTPYVQKRANLERKNGTCTGSCR